MTPREALHGASIMPCNTQETIWRVKSVNARRFSRVFSKERAGDDVISLNTRYAASRALMRIGAPEYVETYQLLQDAIPRLVATEADLRALAQAINLLKRTRIVWRSQFFTRWAIAPRLILALRCLDLTADISVGNTCGTDR